MQVRFILLGLLLCSGALYAQTPAIRHFTDEDGLPNNTCYKIIQDKEGYIWITSDEGLFRWDTHVFQVYKSSHQKSTGMDLVYQDNNGRILGSSFNGQLFEVSGDSLSQIETERHFADIVFTPSGDILLSDALKHTQLHNGQAIDMSNGTIYQKAYLMPNNDFCAITYDDKEAFKIKGIRINADSKQTFAIETHEPHLNKATPSGPSFRYSHLGKQFLFIHQYSKGGVLYLCNEQGQVKQIPLPIKDTQVYRIVGDKSEQSIWILTPDGAFQIDLEGHVLMHILNGTPVSDMIYDHEGNIWFTTLGHGLYQIVSSTITICKPTNTELPEPYVYRLAEDQGQLLLTFRSRHMGVFNPESNYLKVFETPNKSELYGTIPLADGKHYLTYGNAFWLVDKQSSATKMSYVLGSIKDMLQLPNKSQTLIGAEAANFLEVYQSVADSSWRKGLDLRTLMKFGEWIKEPNFALKVSSLRAVRTWSLALDKTRNLLWIVFADDVWVWDMANVKLHIIKLADGKSIHGRDMALAPDGSAWICTHDAGVFYIKDLQVAGQWFKSDTHSALPYHGYLMTNSTRRIFATDKATWVTSGEGLFKIVLGQAVEHIDKSDGLPTNDLSDVYALKGKIWVGSSRGLVALDENATWSNAVAPIISLSGVALFEKALPTQDWRLAGGTKQFAYTDNNIRFDFCGLAWKAPNKMTYRYRLIGLDTAWTRVAGTQQSARYPSLPSGEYRFEVVAENEDGVSSQPVTYNFCIATPFWRKWWFILLCLVGIIGGVTWYYRRRIASINQMNDMLLQKNLIEQELRSSQLSALQSQMNPHFIFNALNSIQEFIFDNEKLLANEYIGKFAELMRITLDMSNEREVTLEDELRLLNLYLELENLRFGRTLEYSIHVDEEIVPEYTRIPSILIQPYVENALKHGLLHRKDSRSLRIEFTRADEGQTLICVVTDNGVGRKRSAELQTLRKVKSHKSFATSATRKRLELLNEGRERMISININDLLSAQGDAIGTQVVLQIPLQNKHFSN